MSLLPSAESASSAATRYPVPEEEEKDSPLSETKCAEQLVADELVQNAREREELKEFLEHTYQSAMNQAFARFKELRLAPYKDYQDICYGIAEATDRIIELGVTKTISCANSCSRRAMSDAKLTDAAAFTEIANRMTALVGEEKRANERLTANAARRTELIKLSVEACGCRTSMFDYKEVLRRLRLFGKEALEHHVTAFTDPKIFVQPSNNLDDDGGRWDPPYARPRTAGDFAIFTAYAHEEGQIAKEIYEKVYQGDSAPLPIQLFSCAALNRAFWRNFTADKNVKYFEQFSAAQFAKITLEILEAAMLKYSYTDFCACSLEHPGRELTEQDGDAFWRCAVQRTSSLRSHGTLTITNCINLLGIMVEFTTVELVAKHLPLIQLLATHSHAYRRALWIMLASENSPEMSSLILSALGGDIDSGGLTIVFQSRWSNACCKCDPERFKRKLQWLFAHSSQIPSAEAYIEKVFQVLHNNVSEDKPLWINGEKIAQYDSSAYLWYENVEGAPHAVVQFLITEMGVVPSQEKLNIFFDTLCYSNESYSANSVEYVWHDPDFFSLVRTLLLLFEPQQQRIVVRRILRALACHKASVFISAKLLFGILSASEHTMKEAKLFFFLWNSNIRVRGGIINILGSRCGALPEGILAMLSSKVFQELLYPLFFKLPDEDKCDVLSGNGYDADWRLSSERVRSLWLRKSFHDLKAWPPSYHKQILLLLEEEAELMKNLIASDGTKLPSDIVNEVMAYVE